MASPTCPSCGSPVMVENGRCAFCQAPLAVSGATAPNAVQQFAPPSLTIDGAFSMQVADVFVIAKRGTVVTGTIATGSISVGDSLRIDRPGGTMDTRCTAIEMFRKQLDTATAGDNVGLLLDRVDKGQVSPGDWVRGRT